MARNHARILTAIWGDDHYTGLTCAAQRLYVLILSQPTLSYAGVAPATIRRWASYASDTDVADIEKALLELVENRFVIHDADTEEVCVRSFLKNDDVLSSPNVCIAMVKDYNAIGSQPIRQAIIEGFPQPLPKPLLKAFPDGFPGRFGEALETLPERVFSSSPLSPSPSPDLSPNPDPSPTPLTVEPEKPIHPDSPPSAELTPTNPPTELEDPDLFDRFWKLYPRKVDKQGARRRFTKALKTATPMEISDGLKAWIPYWAEHDPEFTPHPTTWLNQQRWNDRPPATNGTHTPMPKSADTIRNWVNQ